VSTGCPGVTRGLGSPALGAEDRKALPGESRPCTLKSGDDFAGFAFCGRPASATHSGPN
jgi:hypothetical protein